MARGNLGERSGHPRRCTVVHIVGGGRSGGHEGDEIGRHCRPNLVFRGPKGDIGRGHMQRFQDVETRTPVILTTSQLLTTGLDAPTCRNVVLVRLVNSMVEFKQIIGRGTRVRDDYGKLWFNMLDYTGTATRNFADPAFDGDPAFAAQEEIEEAGKTTGTEVLTAENAENAEKTALELHDEPPPFSHPLPSDGSGAGGEGFGVRCRKYYFDGGQVEIAAELVHELDADGKQLRVVKLTDYTAEKVRTLCASPDAVEAKKSEGQRLNAKGDGSHMVSASSLQHSAFPHFPRRQRADRVKRQQTVFFNYCVPEARTILSELLEKYATHGEVQFVLPDVLKLPPISQHGTVRENADVFGGPDELRAAVNQLQSLLYAA